MCRGAPAQAARHRTARAVCNRAGARPRFAACSSGAGGVAAPALGYVRRDLTSTKTTSALARDKVDLAGRHAGRRSRMRSPSAAATARPPSRRDGPSARTRRWKIALSGFFLVGFAQLQRAFIDIAALEAEGFCDLGGDLLQRARVVCRKDRGIERALLRCVPSLPAGRQARRSRRAAGRPRHSARQDRQASRGASPRTSWSARARQPRRARPAPPPCRQGWRRAARGLRRRSAFLRRISSRRGNACGRTDLGGGKPAKVNRSVGRPDEASAVSGADAPGMAIDGDALLRRLAHQLVAGIGNQRRAGIRHQGDAAPVSVR